MCTLQPLRRGFALQCFSFLPIILRLFHSEKTLIHLQYKNFTAKLPLQIFAARVGLRFAVTFSILVVDARLSPPDGELGDIIYKVQAFYIREFLRILSDYSRIIPDSLTRLLFHFLCRHNRRRPNGQPVGSLPLAQNAWHCTSIIGRAGASPPSRATGLNFLYPFDRPHCACARYGQT